MTKKKKQKKLPLTVEELTRNYDDFVKRNEVKEITKEDFEKTLEKVSKNKPKK